MHLPSDSQNLGNYPYHRSPVHPKIQDLRSIIVQVRDKTNEKVVGTGFVIQGGYILTCAHVAMAAGINPCSNEYPLEPYRSFLERIFSGENRLTTESTNEETLWVRFPQSKAPGCRGYRAKVHACLLNEFEDDIVMLKLADEDAAIPPGVGFAKLGLAEPTTNAMPEDRRFRSFGYRRLGDLDGALWCDGETQGFIGMPSGRNLQKEPLQLISSQISRGMSGAPVLDIRRNLVIGLIAETWNAWNLGFSDRDTAFATAMEVVQNDTFNIDLHEENSSFTTYSTNYSSFCDLGAFANGRSSNHLSLSPESSASHIEDFLINPNDRDLILEAWLNDKVSFVEINQYEEGFENNTSNNGKPSISINQIYLMGSIFPEYKRPQKILWWDFGISSNFVEFLDAFFYMLGIDPNQIATISAKISLVKNLFFIDHNILVLSGPLTEIMFPDGQMLEDIISQLVPASSLCLLIRQES